MLCDDVDDEDDEDDEDGDDDEADEADEAEEADEAHHPVSPTVWRGVDENSSQNPKTAPRPSRSTIPRLVWTEPSANKPVNSCATSIMDQWVIFSPKKTGREPPLFVSLEFPSNADDVAVHTRSRGMHADTPASSDSNDAWSSP